MQHDRKVKLKKCHSSMTIDIVDFGPNKVDKYLVDNAEDIQIIDEVDRVEKLALNVVDKVDGANMVEKLVDMASSKSLDARRLGGINEGVLNEIDMGQLMRMREQLKW